MPLWEYMYAKGAGLAGRIAVRGFAVNAWRGTVIYARAGERDIAPMNAFCRDITAGPRILA